MHQNGATTDGRSIAATHDQVVSGECRRVCVDASQNRVALSRHCDSNTLCARLPKASFSCNRAASVKGLARVDVLVAEEAFARRRRSHYVVEVVYSSLVDNLTEAGLHVGSNRLRG